MQQNQPIQKYSELFNLNIRVSTLINLTSIENFESTNSEVLYPSKISNVPNQMNYNLRKLRKYQIIRFISFANFESTKSEDLYPSQFSNVPNQKNYILRKFRKHQIRRFKSFPSAFVQYIAKFLKVIS